MNIADLTGKRWVSVFNDQALPLLGNKTADELHLLKEEGQVRPPRLVALTANMDAKWLHHFTYNVGTGVLQTAVAVAQRQ